MKTKKKPNILLFLVIAVWLAIGIRAFLLLNPSTPELQQQEFINTTDFKLNTKIDTFSIRTVNRDPFLGTIVKKESLKKTKTKRPKVKWKSIVYQGIIQQDKRKEKVFIVSIGKKQYLIKKGQTRDSTTLVYGNSKSITLRYKNQIQSFSLKK